MYFFIILDIPQYYSVGYNCPSLIQEYNQLVSEITIRRFTRENNKQMENNNEDMIDLSRRIFYYMSRVNILIQIQVYIINYY